jgi:prophage regulatory protein
MLNQTKNDRLLDKKELNKLIPYSYSTIARLEKDGKFPERIRIGPCRVAWSLNEVLQWIEDRKAERQRSYGVYGC